MMENSGFASYIMFHAIKQHFTTKSYDFFKYNGKIKLNQDHFMKDKCKYSYYKLSRKYDLDELRDFLVANFIDREIKWVGDITNEEGEASYFKWKKRNQSLTYIFTENVECLFDKVNKPDELLRIRSGNFPLLLQMTMQGSIEVETLCILNDIMKFLPMWDKKVDDDIIYPEWSRKIIKYTPFIHFDKDKYTNIVKQKIKEYA
jgi:hypothetical protein